MLFIFAGTWVWLFCHLLQGSYVLLGSVEVSEYSVLIANDLQERHDEGFPAIGNGWDIDELGVYLGMICGRDFLNYASGCLALASVFYFLQAALWMIGYFFCLPVPRRFGMFGQILATLGLGAFNMLVQFIFKF